MGVVAMMNAVAVLNTQFVQVALPLMLSLAIAAWLNNRGIDAVGKRIDDLRGEMNGRFDEVFRRLDRLDEVLFDHDQKIVRLEERTSPFAHR
jgi:hypothetical protein